MVKVQIFVLAFVSKLALFEAAKLPTFLNQCMEGNPIILNKCIERNANLAIRDLIKGVLHYDIPAMNPLMYMNTVSIMENKIFSVIFSKMNIFGINQAKISNVNLNFTQKSFQMIISVPNLIITGNYETNGDFFGINIKNSGQFIKNLTEINVLYTFNFNLQPQLDGDYLQIVSSKADFNFAKEEFNLEGLFDDHNYIVSETGDSLYDAFIRRLKQLIKEQMILINMKISEFITTVFNGILTRVPRQEIFIQPKVVPACEIKTPKPSILPDQISSLLSKFMFSTQTQPNTE